MEKSAEILIDLETEEFYEFTRKHLICTFFFMFLYILSYGIIKLLKIRPDNDELYAGDEDYFVHRISTWICSESLSISIAAVTLLPFSVLGAEVLQRFPNNYYLKWLNFSLINTLWNYVFILSNLSLFVLLPFSYFFIESQGFSLNFQLQTLSGSIRRPLLARFYETTIVCALVIVILIGIVDVFYSHLFAHPSYIWLSLICFSSLSTPLLYSFASLFGVFLLLLSVPFGFSKMFDIFSEMLIQQKTTKLPFLIGQINESNNSFVPHSPEKLQEMSKVRKQQKLLKFNVDYCSPSLKQKVIMKVNGDVLKTASHRNKKNFNSPSLLWHIPGLEHLKYIYGQGRKFLNLLIHPLIMLILLILTIACILMVVINTLQLLFGFRALPANVQYMDEYRHMLGIFGAIIEVIIILYIMISSLVGLYSTPFITRIKPGKGKTTITSVILNCMMILILSSALPVLVRTLGITTFDLLGDYGKINWISNFKLIWGYNILFATASILCLINKFTQPVRKELMRRFYTLVQITDISTDTNTYLNQSQKTKST